MLELGPYVVKDDMDRAGLCDVECFVIAFGGGGFNIGTAWVLTIDSSWSSVSIPS
jgi:hypothetical protein